MELGEGVLHNITVFQYRLLSGLHVNLRAGAQLQDTKLPSRGPWLECGLLKVRVAEVQYLGPHTPTPRVKRTETWRI